MADAVDAELIAPLAIDEILIRLLRSPIGGRAAQIGRAASSVSRVAQAIAWLQANYTQPMNIEELAELTHMSVSSFHQHFKAVTTMSPLQFESNRSGGGEKRGSGLSTPIGDQGVGEKGE